MAGREKVPRKLSTFVLSLVILATLCEGSSVTRLSPHYGSLGGETRITIEGSGFSADQFSQNDDPNTGNKVYLISASDVQYSCTVHKDGCTEEQIMCYTPGRMNEEDYYIRVVVDGTVIPDSAMCGGDPRASDCTYKPRAENTPTIDVFKPRSAMPGAFVTMAGKLISDRYGSNIPAATNDKTEKLLRVYVGPQDCALKNGDDFYYLQLDGEDTDEGRLTCRTQGTSVGFYNASFIIESPYGRSKPKANVYHVSYTDTIYMFQTYTDITSISPTSGSTAGGLTLTVFGNYFDNRAPYTAAEAFVGGTRCNVTRVVTDQYLECTVATQPATSPSYQGNRGVTFEYWTGTSKTASNVADVLALTSSSPGYNGMTLDETSYTDVNDTMDDFVSRMTTLFTPPHDGDYKFFLKADDGAKLYVDGVEAVSAGDSWTGSSRMTLSKDSRYKLQVVHFDTTDDAFVELKAKFYNTSFTSAWTGQADQEKQVITISSTVNAEIQTLTFGGYGNRTSVKEVQTIEVDAPAEFRLGLFGVYTTKISVNADATVVAAAINALPVWGEGEAVTVERQVTTPPSFVVTFESKRGDFPPFDVRPVGDGPLFPFDVSETTKGSPDLNTVSLSLDHVVSQPFTMADLTATKLGTVIDGMFEARCPAVFESSSIGKVYQNFESDAATFSGTRVKDTEPFCGRHVLKNPTRVYRKPKDNLGITLATYPTLCFAYKGLFSSTVLLRVSLKQASDGTTVQRSVWHPFAFRVDSDVESDSWYYTCMDIGTIVSNRFPSDSEFRLDEFGVFQQTSESDCYVDAFFVGRANTTTDSEYNLLRRRPARPNGFLINSASVTNATADQYDVTLRPYDCGNEMPLFELGNGQVLRGRVSSPSTSATMALSNGNALTLTVSRSQAASPPVVGNIDVTYKGVTKRNLNVSLEATEFKYALEALAGIGKLSITKTGDCANFNLDVTFLTLPGDLPEMTLYAGSLSGINAAGSISTSVNGGLFYEPLMGDMLSTEHATPQVRVFINGIPTACTGDCSFSWQSSATPTVTAVSPTSGTSALNTAITITGSGFSTTAANNAVTIGGVDCSVTTATASSLVCSVGNGPVGAHKVDVNVAGKGLATHPGGDVSFSYTADITSISPTTGSLGGGSLTITGYGFKSGAMVTINSALCAIVSINPSQIVCNVPPANSAGTHDVIVQQGATTLTYSSYVYDSSLTATISSVIPSTIGVTGATITISGSSFGSSGSVYLDTYEMTVTSWTDTEVVIVTESMVAGELELKVETDSGYAVSSGSLPTVTVDLSVSNISPLHGSILGGTRLTVTGSGFGTNASEVAVKIGQVPCDVTSITNTRMVCQIANAGRVHKVTNMGVDPTFGVYYAFDQPNLEVMVGETVEWEWSTSQFVNDVAHSIIEVESPSSTTPKVGGINSGTPTRQGSYRYQFTDLGTHYVWSGFVDTHGVKNYYGTITVVQQSSYLEQISVKLAGTEAVYNIGGSSDPVDSSSCQAVVEPKSGCTDPLPTGGDSAKFNFAFHTCSTPIITRISATNGTAVTAIILTGEGLSGTNCQNEITIGDYSCDATSSSSTSVTCRVARSGEPEVGVRHPFSVRVGNRGFAMIQIPAREDKSFALIPVIDSIEPTSGSMAGGNTITISGFGFESPLVDVGGYPCGIISSSYTEIRCSTPPSTSQSAAEITVNAFVNGNPLPADCETSTRTCRYSYANMWTPTVTSIDPTTMSGATSFTVKGTGLGAQTNDIQVSIGGAVATVSRVNETVLEGSIANVPAGTNSVVVTVLSKGQASGSLTVAGTATISGLSPSSGSIHGQTVVTISGTGFVVNQTTVSFGGADCDIMSVTLSEIVCTTSAHAAGSVSTTIVSNSVTFPVQSFSYDTSATPTISSVSPISGLPGSTLTISGSNFGSGSPVVLLDDVACDVTTSTSSEITCLIGNHATGSVPVSLYVDGLGASNTDIKFEFQLSVSSISPTTGGTAGGQTVTVSGTGFDSSAVVTICGQTCSNISTTSTNYVCRTAPSTAQSCDVVASLNGLTKTLSNGYTYDASLTPAVSGVTPRRGGTGGGTTITIAGSGFGSSTASVRVTLDNAVCDVTSSTDTEIVCVTGAHSGSVATSVAVEVAGNGIAEESTTGAGAFSYIDVWSSNYTWGGGPLPQEGEFIIIPKGMTLLLDCNTPRLDFLLIKGNLIFDEKDVELQSNIIMITEGGLLQVGTEAAPFQHKAIITLHGHHLSKELPIYGTKVLAVRNGTLELHGIHVPLTWTRLAATAASGSRTLQLQHAVEWNVGDEIVIASTGNHHSQSQNEKHTIAAISADKMTLTLSSPLEAEHLGVEETFDGTLVEFRAEVGLLTHNVVVRGNTDPQWEQEIEACEAGFDTGEFVTQTCFSGRFGDEIGSSQFGAMILVHAPVQDTHEAVARISNTEVTFAGQAFRLGRYPIHFHLNGDMSTSYVKNCGIHKTFNRAVNIHGTHNTLIERTVIYNIMGGAFFLEDGIETGNTIQENLAVFVRESSSLLNDDITPASFWVTNPNNTIQHNAAAGGTHFAYWFRMHTHPEGPSHTSSVCPIQTPLGVFQNNSAHSFGWFGLWIFPDYFPLQGGCGGIDVEPAVFRSLYAWNNDKGAEAVNSGALQFVDFVLVQNRLAGYEGKLIKHSPLYTDESPMLKDSLIVGKTTVMPDTTQGCTKGGLIFGYGAGFRVINVRFVNFADRECSVFRWCRIDGTCGNQCGGYTYYSERIKYVNAPNKGTYDWHWEGMILDTDGTLTGQAANWTVVPTSPTLPTDCQAIADFSKGIPASVCPPQYKFHRFAFNKPNPAALAGKNFLFTNQYGTSSVMFVDKRISHPDGWMCALIGGETYTFQFENALQIRNISFTGQFDRFEASDYLFIKLQVDEFPDRVSIDGGSNYINVTTGAIDPTTARDGDWEWDNANNIVKFIVHGRKRSRRGAGSMGTASVDRPYRFTSFKCFFADCIPPPDPDTIPPASARPATFDYWTDTTMWNKTDDGYVSYTGGSYGVPQEYDNVKIEYGSWVVVNMTAINKIGTLLLEGVLEFIDTPGAVYELNAEYIIIRGGRLIIGWPDDPFDGLASIILRGNHSSPEIDAGDGPKIGAKAIGVFGGLDLFGKDVGLTWTYLAATVNAGTSQIVLRDQVTWKAGDDIVITTTSFSAWETEAFRIVGVASDNVTLTLNDTLKHRHIAHTETLSHGQTFHLAAGVGLLTRNIKVIGEDYANLYQESFGARIVVGMITYMGQSYGGYTRLSNVEFYRTGQEGYTESYDPRFSVAFIAAGTVSDIKPSFVANCSFHDGFNTAVGAFGIGGLNITDNVVYKTVGHSIVTSSEDTSVIRNMVTLMIATPTYQDRFESYNFRWEAGIDALLATRLTLKDNLVAGSERVGFHVVPHTCTDTSNSYENNLVIASYMGVAVFNFDTLPSGMTCAKLQGFTAWKSLSFGMYYQNDAELVITDNVLIENTNSLFTIVLKPSALGHQYANKTTTVQNTTFVGFTDSFDCTADAPPRSDRNLILASMGSPSTLPNNAMAGLIFPNFYQASNNAPSHPFRGCMAYASISGLMIVSDVTFAKFDSTCRGAFAVSTNIANDDLQHPIHSSGVTMIDVQDEYKIYIHRPNVGKINSADCVDMDCDGLKKALYKDLDGTFLGNVGSVISQSEFEWGGDPRRGLDNSRIPKDMLTRPDGTTVDADTLAPNKGIIRNTNCTFVSAWNAYKCGDDLNYRMLVIESMDEDTETRRLSPVAILGDGYLDLINGPQDHGWCSGYTCRLRLSTFSALIATGKEYLIYLSSVTPKHLRYRLLHAEDTETIKLATWYASPNRQDVYVDDTLAMAANAYTDNQGRYRTTLPQGDEYIPVVGNDTGTNFFDKTTGLVHFVMKGTARIDVITKETIVMSFGMPSLSVADFYGDNMIENIAAFLNIPLNKIRVVSVVSAATSGRKKRSTSGITAVIEIGDEPSSTVNGTVSNSLDTYTLLTLASDLLNECQVGDPSSSFNMTGSCESVSVPSSDPNVAAIVYSTPTPDSLFFETTLVPEYEGVALKTQPRIRVSDKNGITMTSLGTSEYPWQLTASIRSGTGHPNAQLNGTLLINSTNGWFNFTDLNISHMGTGYILDFNVTFPTQAANFTLSSAPFNLDGRPLKIGVASITSGDISKNSRFSVTLNLKDNVTNEVISAIDWRSHTWTSSVSMLASNYATLEGTLTSTFDLASGEAMFADLTITGVGSYYLVFNVVSTPNDYNLSLSYLVEIVNPAHVGMVVEETYEVEVKFDVDFNKVLVTEEDQHQFTQNIMAQYANTWTDVKLTFNRMYSGSIVVVFSVAGSSSNVNSTAYAVCGGISNGTVYSFKGYNLQLSSYMMINNVSFFGVTCGEIPSTADDATMEAYLIGIIVALCILIVIVVAVVIYWRVCLKSKKKSGNLVANAGTFHHQIISKKTEAMNQMMFDNSSYFGDYKPALPAGDLVNTAAPLSTHWMMAQRQVDEYLDTMKDPFSRALKAHKQKVAQVQQVKVAEATTPEMDEYGNYDSNGERAMRPAHNLLRPSSSELCNGRQRISPLPTAQPAGTPMIHRRGTPAAGDDVNRSVTPVGRE